MVGLDREFNVITEFKNELKPEDIFVFYANKRYK